MSTNETNKIIVSNSWIIKVGFYDLKFAQQSDSILIVKTVRKFYLFSLNIFHPEHIDVFCGHFRLILINYLRLAAVNSSSISK